MKTKIFYLLLLCIFAQLHIYTFAQNTGIGITTPAAKLHIKGSADASQLIIDANSTQSNVSPLVRLRNSSGSDLLHIHSDHIFNTFIGLNSGKSNAASGFNGVHNSFIGSGTGYSNTSGYANTAIGTNALYYNTAGYGNTALGPSALFLNNTGYLNTAIGASALENNTTASENTAIGLRALNTQSFNNGGGTWSSANTAVGYYALYSNQPTTTAEGVYNTALGHSALYSNTTGASNTASGFQALQNNTTGKGNTASGVVALQSNTLGNNNTAIGAGAMRFNTTAGFNTAVGNNALWSQSFSNANESWLSANTAVGADALFSNQPLSASNGNHNTAVGFYALRTNTWGRSNTAMGYYALYANTTGYFNTAVGVGALQNSNGSVADANTAVGYNALSVNSNIGFDNVAVGYNAGNDLNSLNYNTLIGSGAHSSASNSVVIGYNGFTNTPNLALLGNTFTAYCGGYVGWTTYISDGRFKKNVQENVSGLAFINQLRPVTYTLDIVGLNKFQGADEYRKKINIPRKEKGSASSIEDDESDKLFEKSITEKETIIYSGFIAQEVEEAAKKSGYNFSGLKKPQNNQDNYGLTYSDFVVPLVKAVQEQQTIIEKQQQQINLLLKRIEALEKK